MELLLQNKFITFAIDSMLSHSPDYESNFTVTISQKTQNESPHPTTGPYMTAGQETTGVASNKIPSTGQAPRPVHHYTMLRIGTKKRNKEYAKPAQNRLNGLNGQGYVSRLLLGLARPSHQPRLFSLPPPFFPLGQALSG